MIESGLSAFEGKRVLLLQGPLGPFFKRLATDLTQAGAEVHKVNFNGGDWLFFRGPRAYSFRGKQEAWPAFFERLLDQLQIETVLLFGDCRQYHRQAYAIATARGIEVGVFEEGYLRPNWITLELSGANGHSKIPSDPKFYRNIMFHPNSSPEQAVGDSFAMAALWAILYYVTAFTLWPLFRRYRHHRPLSLLEALPWIRAGWRKLHYAYKERDVLSQLTQEKSKNYYLVPLQVHNDAQVCVHSPYADVSEFIKEVVTSFAKHAPQEAALVIKHHPMDRGYHDYSALIRGLRRGFGLDGRLVYVHDTHLPTLLDHAAGVVVINSTVGLSALLHGAPTITTGSAFYDIDGMTYQGSLESFWAKSREITVDKALLNGFRVFLQRCKLINGNYYKRLPASELASGLVWPKDCRWSACDSPSLARNASPKPAFLHSTSQAI